MVFRKKFATQIFLSRLDYMWRVLQEMYGMKAQISDPDAFKDKVRNLEKRLRKLMKRSNSATSAITSFMSSNTMSKMSSNNQTMQTGDDDDDEDIDIDDSNYS